MIDALLFAVRDGIRGAGIGYNSAALCEVMPSGEPPVGAGNFFVSVHGGQSTSRARRNLDEYFGFSLTLTMKTASIPWPDHTGISAIVSKLTRTGTAKEVGFNARTDVLRAYLHMNWTIMASANTNLANWAPPSVTTVYGFVEPMGFVSREQPQPVGPDWFGAEPSNTMEGIKCELRFDGARRMQPQTAAVGPYL